MTLFQSVRNTLLSVLKTRQKLTFENLAFRQQLAVLHRSAKRPPLTRTDRLFWAVVSRFWTHWSEALLIVQPQTVLRWHRQGFRPPVLGQEKPQAEARGHPFLGPTVRNLIRNMWSASSDQCVGSASTI